MTAPRRAALLIVPAALAALSAARADGPAPKSAGKLDFNRDVRPVLSDNCFACHGPDAKKRKADLRLDVWDASMKSDGVVVPGKAADSELFKRLVAGEKNKLMPPAKSGKKLTAEQVALLKRWIDEGASYSEHWAYVAPKRPPLPAVKGAAWPRNPIDRFVLARLEAEGLAPSPEAGRTTLIRRVTFDLTGLPPSPEEVDAFLADRSANAYEKVVERLLKSPRYGEHLGRYWLDLARFGDTHGLHLDNYREMWPYRDWVVRAFNANKPYDKFVTEQIAGDLLPGGRIEDLVATGFNRAHVTTSEGGSITEEIHVRNVNDRVETAGTVFLGLTVGCARCHDHKYDPVTQKDFYSLSAFFNSLEGNPLDGNAARHPPVLPLPSPEQSAALAELGRKADALRRQLAEKAAVAVYDDLLDASKALGDWLKAARAGKGGGLPPNVQALVKLKPEELSPQQRQELRDHFVQRVWPKGKKALAPLRKQLAAVEAERKKVDEQVPVTYVFKETPEPRQAFILKRGEYDQRGAAVERATPVFLPPLPAKAKRDRLTLAKWLLAPDQPLTARVAVNRYWQQIFGTGLVKTSEDFGVQGEPPSHPELLDWLAVEYRDGGWDTKQLTRLLVTSAAYRQSSKVTKERQAKDPANRLLSRGPRFRLDAEMLRDQALAVSGLLVEKVGGPSVKPPQPAGLWSAVAYVASNTAKFVADRGPEKVHRRGLYTFWKRTAPPPQMGTFDAPSRESCTARRERTNTPLQALLLLNDKQYVECARALAERVLRGESTTAGRVEKLFRLATCRRPDAAERAELEAALGDLIAEYRRDPSAAAKLIAAGESKPSVGADPAELAAWTMLASTVLNLDEVLNKG